MTRHVDTLAPMFGVEPRPDLDGLYPPGDAPSERDERLDAAAIDALAESIRLDVERRARNRAEREAGPLVERMCSACGDALLAPASAIWSRCQSGACGGQVRALVPESGGRRAAMLLALCEAADRDAVAWLVFDPSRPGVMADLARRAKARADRWRRMAGEASGGEEAA